MRSHTNFLTSTWSIWVPLHFVLGGLFSLQIHGHTFTVQAKVAQILHCPQGSNERFFSNLTQATLVCDSRSDTLLMICTPTERSCHVSSKVTSLKCKRHHNSVLWWWDLTRSISGFVNTACCVTSHLHMWVTFCPWIVHTGV